jgi:hypothetical protein
MGNLIELTDTELLNLKKEGCLEGPLTFDSPNINETIFDRLNIPVLSNYYKAEARFQRTISRKAKKCSANAIHMLLHELDLIEGKIYPYLIGFYNVSQQPS